MNPMNRPRFSARPCGPEASSGRRPRLVLARVKRTRETRARNVRGVGGPVVTTLRCEEGATKAQEYTVILQLFACGVCGTESGRPYAAYNPSTKFLKQLMHNTNRGS